MKVAALQYDIVWRDRGANFALLEPLIAQAARAGARLIVLPEMFSTGFVMDADVGEPENGESSGFLGRMATTHGAWVAGTCPEIADGDPRPFNSFVVAGPSGTLHRYRKIHPFTYGGEHERFRAGSEPVTIDIDGVRTSLFVCYDLRFADEFWSRATGTDLYVVPANWPTSRRDHWTALLKARAIENQAYVIGCNRIGAGGGLSYSGDSMIIDPLGEVLADAGNAATTVVADVDASHVAAVRERFPFLRDRR